jgi:hypothetical protein
MVAERAAAQREQAAAARIEPTQGDNGAESTNQPDPSPEAAEDPEMATPAQPATPETPEAATPETEDTPQAEQESNAAPSAPDTAESAAKDSADESNPAADSVPVPSMEDAEPAPEPVEQPVAAEPSGELPLWTGPGELPLWTGPEDTDPAQDSFDVIADFAAVKDAWNEHVPADRGTGDDLFAELDEPLNRLEALFAEVAAKVKPAPAAAPAAAVQSTEPDAAAAPSPGEQEAPPKAFDPQQSAEAVNAALRDADAHAPALQDLPEWQRIQSVRGAFGHLMHVIKERAGEHLGNFMADSRVSDWLRRVSIRACEKVAEWAQGAADKMRRPDERGTDKREGLPSAEALQRLGDAALEYSRPRHRGGGTPPPPSNGAANPVDIPAMRKMGEALNRPMPGAKRGVSTAAARGRSTTTAKKGGKKPAPGGTEQARHLRRDGVEQQQTRKPTQR